MIYAAYILLGLVILGVIQFGFLILILPFFRAAAAEDREWQRLYDEREKEDIAKGADVSN